MRYRAVWKHKTDKTLFAEQPYYWVDSIVVIDESQGREVIHIGKATAFDFSKWIRCTHTELQKVKGRFRDIYDN